MNSDEWETPQWLFDELNREFDFGIDLCSSWANTKCDWRIKDYLDGDSDIVGTLEAAAYDKTKSAFMNPPYSNPLPFVKKAYTDSLSCKIVCLLKCDTSTKAWGIFWDYERHCPKPGIEVRFLPKRLKFELDGIPAKNSANFPSTIVIMDRRKIKVTS
jgi:site-specific DNA-methyltransferase (adenine-specific)